MPTPHRQTGRLDSGAVAARHLSPGRHRASRRRLRPLAPKRRRRQTCRRSSRGRGQGLQRSRDLAFGRWHDLGTGHMGPPAAQASRPGLELGRLRLPAQRGRQCGRRDGGSTSEPHDPEALLRRDRPGAGTCRTGNRRRGRASRLAAGRCGSGRPGRTPARTGALIRTPGSGVRTCNSSDGGRRFCAGARPWPARELRLELRRGVARDAGHCRPKLTSELQCRGSIL